MATFFEKARLHADPVERLAVLSGLARERFQAERFKDFCGQCLDPLLTSLILGKDLQLHPVTILLSLFVCTALLGFFGMLLAVPLVATAKILAREFLLPSLEALARETPDGKARPEPPPAGGPPAP